MSPSPLPLCRPLCLCPSPPVPNADLIYDVCTGEMTLERPFKSSCHCCSPCKVSSYLYSLCIKAKSLFPAREWLQH